MVAAVAADAAVLVHRMPTIALSPSGAGDGTAYLLLASDSRERLTGADRKRYADAAQAEGERADLVLLLRRTAAGRAELLSVPRDLYVGAGGDNPHRLGLALQGGAQDIVDSLCANLGVGVDHVAVLDFRGLVELVDAAGGVDVQTPGPLRDKRAGLALDSGGEHHLDGLQALAWVRSRHPEVLVDGRWSGLTTLIPPAPAMRWTSSGRPPRGSTARSPRSARCGTQVHGCGATRAWACGVWRPLGSTCGRPWSPAGSPPPPSS